MSGGGPSLLVIVVNYRTGGLVVDCLRSLQPEVQANPGTRVVVVDNASGDDSLEVLANAIESSGWSSWASLVASPSNGGFAYGNNVAMRAAMADDDPPDAFWLLNPDTVVRPGAVATLRGFLAEHPRVGICGGGIDEADGSQWPYAFRFPGLLSEVERGCRFGPISWLLSRFMVRRRMGSEPAKVDWVSGATMAVRRETVEQVGLMDEGYFLYFEETDYCLRANRQGVECWFVPQCRVMHIAGQSTSVTAKTDTPKRLPDYWFESRRRYFVQNHGRLYAALVDIAWMISFCFGQLRCWLMRRPGDATPHLFTDFLRHSALWRSRRTAGDHGAIMGTHRTAGGATAGSHSNE